MPVLALLMSTVLSSSRSTWSGMSSRRPSMRTRMLLSMIVARSSIMYCSKQVHQEVDLGLRPLPVLARQAIQRELLDLEPGAFLGRAADRIDAALVAGDARQILPLGPAAVAVHDDRDVPRPALGRDVRAIGDDRLSLADRGSRLADDNRLIALRADGDHLDRLADQLADAAEIGPGVGRQLVAACGSR